MFGDGIKIAKGIYTKCSQVGRECLTNCPLNQPVYEHSEDPKWCDWLNEIDTHFELIQRLKK